MCKHILMIINCNKYKKLINDQQLYTIIYFPEPFAVVYQHWGKETQLKHENK